MSEGAGGTPEHTLSNGLRLPAIGLGCAQLEDSGKQDELIARAYEVGYRLFDNARLYGNEHLVGAAIRSAGIDRDTILLSSKVLGSEQGFENTLHSCERSMAALGTTYLDIYLIHWPAKDPAETLETWRAMERLYGQGSVKTIGVSNFGERDLAFLTERCNVKPMLDQLEFNPYHGIVPLRQYCAEQGIVVEGYFPLGGQVVGAKGIRKPPPPVQLFEHPVICELARDHRKSVAQIILRWEAQSGVIPLPKTTRVHRLEENISIFDFELSAAEMERMNGLDYGFSIGPDDSELDQMK